eukprot:TRINITY_DN1071_c0_g1_i1.p1 TRINITY_DN1071_c0_g1~~TRINITY_DN1071_c0_g1_i1.p1  ORF type:complete len:508 (-),score=134.08 TRINITY_DN1071_c0_g1_i1:76-1599(-)
MSAQVATGHEEPQRYEWVNKDASAVQFSRSTTATQEESLSRHLETMIAKCDATEQPGFAAEMEGFKQLFAQFKEQKGKLIEWEKIKPPADNLVVPMNSLPTYDKSAVAELSKKLCVLKLNGGLGTTMGCTGPKSVIEVHSELSFLDLTVAQIEHLNHTYNANVPLILMNSFNTHEETLKVIKKYEDIQAQILSFNQSRFPRISKESYLPLSENPNGDKEAWYPPGHGDVWRAFVNSGLCEEMIQQGKEYVFISNIDNLGATVNFDILNYMVKEKVDYVMEVTDKTRSDVKGGTLIDYEGKPRLFEIAQCPPSKLDEFKSIKKFKIFNTNNLWVSLRAILHLVKENKLNGVDVITNYKKAMGKDCIQLETACGAAVQFFNNAKGINVPRSRFLPVKSTSDLFVVQSNLYELQNGTLQMHKKRTYPSVPLVNLGENFKTVSNYNSRLKSIPDILELDQLTVSGDVTFGTNVVLKGTVIIVANIGNRIDIPDGSVIENKVISGNLRILDH